MPIGPKKKVSLKPLFLGIFIMCVYVYISMWLQVSCGSQKRVLGTLLGESHHQCERHLQKDGSTMKRSKEKAVLPVCFCFFLSQCPYPVSSILCCHGTPASASQCGLNARVSQGIFQASCAGLGLLKYPASWSEQLLNLSSMYIPWLNWDLSCKWSNRSPFIMCTGVYMHVQTHAGTIAFVPLKNLCNTWK